MKNFLYLLICLLSFTSIAAAQPDIISLDFGNSGHLILYPGAGTFDVWQHDEIILKQCSSSAMVNGHLVRSDQYQTYIKAQQTFRNAMGRGLKTTISLTATGMPEMEQVYYTFPEQEYFLMETVIRGTGLTSNYIAPLNGSLKDLTGDQRTLFVPFDNDNFVSYNSKAFSGDLENSSAEVGAVYDNVSRKGLVIGSVEHAVWKTGVVTTHHQSSNTIRIFGGYTDEKVTRDHRPHGSLHGNQIKSPLIFVGYFKDWRDGLENFGKSNRLTDPSYVLNWKKATPVGWNSWGEMQAGLTYEKVIKVAGFLADSIPAFRSGHTAYIDLDSYWDHMLKGGVNGDWSQLKAFANYCKARGLEPGIYWAPFADWLWKSGPERRVEGSSYYYGNIWTKNNNGYYDLDGARALDPTHPGTRQRIDFMIGKFKACGFRMIKIDFLGHAALESSHFYDSTATTGMQAYRMGMEYLIDQMDGQMLVYAAISPSLATGRYAHMRRAACDAFKSIEDTKYTLNSLNYGWWLSSLYNYIDADHVVMAGQSEGENRARLLSAIIAGTLITGDDFSKKISVALYAKHWLQDTDLLAVIKNGKSFRPVEGNTGTGTCPAFYTKAGDYYYLAIFNFSSHESSFEIDAERIGLSKHKCYTGEELFCKKEVFFKEKTTFTLSAADAVLYRLKK